MQHEHRVFKGPFIINGMDYMDSLKNEFNLLEVEFNAKYYIENEINIPIRQESIKLE